LVFFHHPATARLSPLSLHDALPISRLGSRSLDVPFRREHVPLTTGLLEAQQPRLFHRRQQLEEAREPVLALVEVGALADDGLLERRRIHRPGGLREEALGDVLGDTRDRVLALLALLLAGALRRLGGAGLAAFVLAVLVLAVG